MGPKNNPIISSKLLNTAIGETDMHDIKSKALRSGLAKLFGQAANSVLRVGFLVVLARLLDPGDFGLVAMVTVVTTFLERNATIGLSSGAIQRADVTSQQNSTLFWINLFVGLFLAVVCVAIAPVLVAFYHEPRLLWVTVAMGAVFVFGSAGVQHNVLLQRELRYGTLTLIEVFSQLASFLVGTGLALAGYGYWALVAAAIALPAMTTACLYFVTGWKPGKPRWDTGVRSMLGFGGTITLNGLVIYVAYNLDKVLIGRAWGTEALGLYTAATQLINFPTAQLHVAIGGVALSALSRLQHDVTRHANYFLKAYTLIVSATLPLTIFTAVFTEDLVLAVLGSKWVSVVPICRLLSPTILTVGVISPFAWFLFSIGNQMRSLHIAFVIAALTITSYFIGLPYGPEGVALAYSSAMMIWLVPHIFWCTRGTPLSVWEVLRIAGRPLISTGAAVAVAYAVQSNIGGLPSPIIRLLLEGSIMVAVYSMLLLVMGQKDFYLDLFRAVTKSPDQNVEAGRLANSPLTRQ
ncbi:MAG TPA: lipopolysaccharide biosynthesis protein [Xanthobacteraceae bacterium]|nr:lipopolysaccharide biosynthesis protein [Xanthobacteraceae bacterium]